MTGDTTVEWGEDRPARWIDRILGDADATGRRRLSPPALACAILAVVLMFAAELLPWMILDRPSDFVGPFGGEGSEAYLSDVGGFPLTGYYPGWLGLLAVLGVALVTRPESRRPLVAGGLGLAAGLLGITASIARQGGDSVGLGPGMFFGFAGVLAAAAALILTGWQPGPRGARRADPKPQPDVDPGPPDLTVTPSQ